MRKRCSEVSLAGAAPAPARTDLAKRFPSSPIWMASSRVGASTTAHGLVASVSQRPFTISFLQGGTGPSLAMRASAWGCREGEPSRGGRFPCAAARAAAGARASWEVKRLGKLWPHTGRR